MKPGIKTTEFWMSTAVIVALLALLVGYGVISEEESNLWYALAVALVPVGYSISRAIAKKNE